MQLHLEKKAIRVLGVAERFRPNDVSSMLAGVVMRADLVIDGFARGNLRVSGSNGTEAIVRLFSSLKRNDVNAVMISGSVLSLYNVLDIDLIHLKLNLPVLALSFSKSRSNLAENIKARFSPRAAKRKIDLLVKLGASTKIGLATGYDVFLRAAGIDADSSKRLLDRFTLQGGVPEPVRVAKLLAIVLASSRIKKS